MTMTMTTKFDIQRFAPMGDNIAVPAWVAYDQEHTAFIYIPEGVEAFYADGTDYYDDSHGQESDYTIKIEGASNVTGDDKNFTVTPAEGKTFADVKVTKNSTEHDLNITIGETVYSVNTDGTLADPSAQTETAVTNTTKVSLQLKETTADGKKTTKTLNYVNPKADDAVLASFAIKRNSLSENTYVDTIRVEKEEINLPKAEEPAAKKSPQLSVSPTSIERSSGESGTITVTRLGTGTISYEYDTAHYQNMFYSHPTINDNVISYKFSPEPADEDATLEFVVKVAETDEYESGTATVSIHISGIGGVS